MTENMKALVRAASQDQGLKDRMNAVLTELRNATETSRPEIIARAIAVADENGLTLTEEDLDFELPTDGALDDEEMALVSGGWSAIYFCLQTDRDVFVEG